METTALDEFEALLGYTFAQRALLIQALTHSSLAHERGKSSPGKDNEQLEFLGDAVVGLLVAESLFRSYPALGEGQLTRLRAALVSRRHLGQVAARLDLGRFLLLGRGEERSGGRKRAPCWPTPSKPSLEPFISTPASKSPADSSNSM